MTFNQYNVTTITQPHTASNEEYIISNGSTVTLPEPSENAIVAVASRDGTRVPVEPNATELVEFDSAASVYSGATYFVSDGTNWYLESGRENVFGAIPDSEGGQVSTITIDGVDYRRHLFESSGTFEIDGDAEVDILLVGGGGGGADKSEAIDAAGGGGGAGGLVYAENLEIDAGEYSISVGSGGSGLVAPSSGGSTAGNGEDSNAFELTAIGGGGGGGAGEPTEGEDGGSGGGGGRRESASGGSALQPGTNTGVVYDEGSDGGAAKSGSESGADSGGGGGATESGEQPDGNNEGGDGGDGRNLSDIFDSDVGENGAFAGGGGGGGEDGPGGTGGLGGGGDGGGSNDNGENGMDGTGGGGGGAGESGGDGGDGVVIVRLGPL